jgi:hypothetical protein
MIYNFDHIEDAKKVGEAFRLMGLSASTVDRPLSPVDTRLETALRQLTALAEQS